MRDTSRSSTGQFASSGDIAARFASKHVVDGECWRWTDYIGKTGRGMFWLDGKMVLAPRLSYELHVGPIPEGMLVTQTCRNGWCVSPTHLALARQPRPRQSMGRSAEGATVYGTPEWKQARAAALLRDGNRCTVCRFFGGVCTDVLHVHHIVPLADGGHPYALNNLGTTCSRHHPLWEALRREVVRELDAELYHRVTCRHRHRSAEARQECEARMARDVQGRRHVAA